MSAIEPLETITVAEAAASRLRDSLFAGVLGAGEEIKDTRIAADFGIARPTARVAVQELINDGMLVRPPGFSARVRSFDPDEVTDIYRVRRLIEIEAVRVIWERRPSLRLVEQALVSFAESQQDTNDWLRIARADFEFHSAVVETAGSPRLQMYFAAIANETRLLIALLKTQYSRGESLYAEHEELYRLLGAADCWSDVESEWAAHLASAEEFLRQRLA